MSLAVALSRARCAIAVAAVATLLSMPTAAQEPLPPALQALLRTDNPVVGTVGATQIRWNDVIYSAAALPPEQQAQVGPLFSILLSRLVDRQLLSDAARQQGYAGRPEIREAVRRYEADLIRDSYVEDYLAGVVTPQAVETRVRALSDGTVRGDVQRRIEVREEMSRLALDRLLAQLREGTPIQIYPTR
ncbi:MAG: hypothetical protein AAFY02_05940 [Pseudomonadota bacterium]